MQGVDAIFVNEKKEILLIPRPVSECDEVKWFKKEEIRTMRLAYDHKEMLEDLELI